MLGFLRFFIVGLIVLTVFYWLLSIYMRSTTRERLEDEWAEEGSIGARDDYVEKGMADYEQSLQPKLLWLVYILPVTAFVAVFYITNFM